MSCIICKEPTEQHDIDNIEICMKKLVRKVTKIEENLQSPLGYQKAKAKAIETLTSKEAKE